MNRLLIIDLISILVVIKRIVVHTNELLANKAGNVDSKGVIWSGLMKAQYMDTIAYGSQLMQKPTYEEK